MIQRIRRCFSLRGDERGAQAVEFAFAAPLAFLLTCGVVELGTVLFVNVLLESGMRDAARFGITGQDEGSDDRIERIMEIIEDRSIGLVDIEDAKISILSYPSFDDIGRSEDFVDGNGNGQYDLGETFDDENDNGAWDEDVGKQGAGGSGEVVVYQIEYDWKLMTPMISSVMGDEDGKFKLSASVVVRNEPWEETN